MNQKIRFYHVIRSQFDFQDESYRAIIVGIWLIRGGDERTNFPRYKNQFKTEKNVEKIEKTNQKKGKTFQSNSKFPPPLCNLIPRDINIFDTGSTTSQTIKLYENRAPALRHSRTLTFGTGCT